ncbi:DUF930 domain-containing protein [Hansschlegelia plantiphila]|uniref:DUF930 domain-containing protein n=1 Tax=Hansschlegelia plantiphila TaxID=374655 RepID=A0A9W6J2S3_9HYPH|nr:DUF930 domain-containing protein [Hansschlegelia plantiphila]GLK68318.1 hypothetical protein GCM10008179_19560 [Hansschlegelia plantiphila]
MRSILPAAVALALASTPAAAFDDRVEASLRKLEPETRFHQICDIETMRRIQADDGPLHPDRMVMDARSDAALDGDVLSGSGGAIRSAGKWYRLTFRCRASADRMTVLALTYRIGEAIPEREWERYGLWR